MGTSPGAGDGVGAAAAADDEVGGTNFLPPNHEKNERAAGQRGKRLYMPVDHALTCRVSTEPSLDNAIANESNRTEL
jgi:hypothetical protein